MNPPYINRCTLQGRIVSQPTTKSISERTKITTFQLVLVESWRNAQGDQGEHKNRVTIEVVGRDSARAAEEAACGRWASVEGYIRTGIFKGQEITKVRTLTIDIWG